MDPIIGDTIMSHFNSRMVLCTIGICCGSLSFGYAAAIIATTLGQPSFRSYMNLTDENPNTAHIEGAMNSLFYAGGFFGSIFTAWFADRFGRKTSIALGSLIVLLSCALCAGSVDVAMFIVFRFCTGWGCLMLLQTVPLWITETAPPHGRGVLSTLHAMMAAVGYLAAAYVGVGFFYYQNANGQQWRAPLAIGCLFPLVNLALMPILPESPRFLLTKEHTQRAWKVVERLRRTDDSSYESSHREFEEMKRQIELDRTLDSSWRVLLTRPSYRKRVLIACLTLSMIYSSGTLVVSNYGPILFASLGFSASKTLLFQGGIILVSCSAIGLSMLFIDRVPRNKIIAGGLLVVSVPLAGEAAMTASFLGSDNKVGLGWGVAFLYLYIWLYGLTLDGPGYYYANEIFPTHLRAKGATCCIASYSLINIMWTQIAPIAFQHIGWRFYIVFIACCIVSSAIVWFYFPDTLNKPLEEVAALFGDADLIVFYNTDASASIEKRGIAKEHVEALP